MQLIILFFSAIVFILALNRLRITTAVNRLAAHSLTAPVPKAKAHRTLDKNSAAALPDPVQRFHSFVLREGQPDIHTVRFRYTLYTADRPDCTVSAVFNPLHGFLAAVSRSGTLRRRFSSYLCLKPGQQHSAALHWGFIPGKSSRTAPSGCFLFHNIVCPALWFPTALFSSPLFSWSESSADSALLTVRHGDATALIKTFFSSGGEITAMELYSADQTAICSTARCDNYRQSGCMKVPGTITVSGSGPELRFKLNSITYNPPPTRQNILL